MTIFLWVGFLASFLPHRWFKTRDARRWRNGRHWRKAPTGESESARIGSANADSPVGHNADVLAAAAETAGGRNSDQDGTE